MPLTQEEIDGCSDAFLSFEKDRGAGIEVWDLRQVLEAIGQSPSDEDLFQMVSDSEAEFEEEKKRGGKIDFGSFLRIIETQKERAAHAHDETDMVDAFVACGGNADRSGHVERSTLVRIIKQDFHLAVDIDALIDHVDKDGSGEIEFQEFLELMRKDKPS